MKSLTFFCLIFCLNPSFPNTLFAQSPTPQPSPDSEELPPVAKDPPPNNKTHPGGGLNREPNTCQAEKGQLTALIPESNSPHPPLTLANSFTLLLYFPDDASSIKKVEFWINSRDEKVRIFPKTSIPLSNLSGIVSITLPNELQTQLETGQNYHWFIKVSCQNQSSIALNGWLQKVDNSQETRWYDSLADLAKQRSQNPDNSTIQAEWKRFLDSINETDLVNQPIYFIDLNN